MRKTVAYVGRFMLFSMFGVQRTCICRNRSLLRSYCI